MTSRFPVRSALAIAAADGDSSLKTPSCYEMIVLVPAPPKVAPHLYPAADSTGHSEDIPTVIESKGKRKRAEQSYHSSAG